MGWGGARGREGAQPAQPYQVVRSVPCGRGSVPEPRRQERVRQACPSRTRGPCQGCSRQEGSWDLDSTLASVLEVTGSSSPGRTPRPALPPSRSLSPAAVHGLLPLPGHRPITCAQCLIMGRCWRAGRGGDVQEEYEGMEVPSHFELNGHQLIGREFTGAGAWTLCPPWPLKPVVYE